MKRTELSLYVLLILLRGKITVARQQEYTKMGFYIFCGQNYYPLVEKIVARFQRGYSLPRTQP